MGSFRFTLLCAAALAAAPAASAVDWKALKPEGFVSDFARVVDARSRSELESYCAVVKQQTGAEIALVTIQSLEDEPVDDVANTIFRAWGVGEKGKNNGILLLLAIRERRSRLEVGYEIEPLIPDGYAGSVLREMRPALREGHYGEALMAAAQVIGSKIAQAKGVALQAMPRRTIRERPYQSIPWPVIIGGIALLFLFMRRGGTGGGGGFLTGLLLGNLLGRSHRGWDRGGSGGGGFGGFDSGDSFGGFGGGDSGGGGASSDW